MTTHETWLQLQQDITQTILEDPKNYFIKGYTIGKCSMFEIIDMLEQDIFCFSKAWFPFTTENDDDKLNISLLRIDIYSIIKNNNYSESFIFQLIDAYPFLDYNDEDNYFRNLVPIVKKYKKYKSDLQRFSKSEYAKSLSQEIVDLILAY
jgi:hypothetical protein